MRGSRDGAAAGARAVQIWFAPPAPCRDLSCRTAWRAPGPRPTGCCAAELHGSSARSPRQVALHPPCTSSAGTQANVHCGAGRHTVLPLACPPRATYAGTRFRPNKALRSNQMKGARSGVAPAPGSTKPDDGKATASLRPSRGVRTGTVGNTRLAADAPASRGVTRHFQDANRISLGRIWVPARPSGVSTPVGLAPDAALRATEAAWRPCLCFRSPSEASVAVPHGPAGP